MKIISQAGTSGEISPIAGPTPLEQLIEDVLRSPAADPNLPSDISDQVRRILQHDTRRTRVVVLGGGTGLSTVVGGNSAKPGWSKNPSLGLKENFPRLDLIAVTTDDGGSTGQLLRELPLIGIGDLRKSCLSLISLPNLQRLYQLNEQQSYNVVELIQLIFNHRFPDKYRGFKKLKNPLLAVSPKARRNCPPELSSALNSLGSYVSPEGDGPTILPGGHNLGNLLLAAAIFRAAGGRTDRAPGLRAIQRGIDTVSRITGARVGHLHAATSTPGQLSFRYSNGVEVLGQRKADRARRGFPVERITAYFSRPPAVGSAVLHALRDADLIIYAPGSLFSSMIPLLQIDPILSAIRENRKAIKILAANFWVQEGETDISPGQDGRGFLVSELIEAYDRNVPGGVRGLFQLVLSANLDYIPGNILRNYALEGKTPIHLDKKRVEEMGFLSVEAILFPLEGLKPTSVIHHDPKNFALAIRTILYAWNRIPSLFRKNRAGRDKTSPARDKAKTSRSPILYNYLSSVQAVLKEKEIQPAELKEIMTDLIWENRDISLEHLKFFRSITALRAQDRSHPPRHDDLWGRYNHVKESLEIHEQLLEQPGHLRSSLLVALGTSLLGNAFEEARWADGPFGPEGAGAGYLVRLRPARRRHCLLTGQQLRRYLELTRLTPDRRQKRVYRTVTIDREKFLAPHLFFGLLYAWYLNNDYVPALDYEMSLLRWPARLLMPFQREDQKRRQALVSFFRIEIFGYPD
ncbi:MAG: 2-phospho-L-lactate transferase CofD family protein [Candidatus Euphemobacter frigidus]|nr:2-phospho-L-lactate transferase CofD family protein [Candidatus Euphemobacter frigidus]MDP8276227.1 2-phospho-L-lactate transferase CofD family protein [Candidatus Euphemobacter frigidus]